MPTTITTLDCEGACCCRCTTCKGVGYWSEYDITFPSVDYEWWCVSGMLHKYAIGSVPPPFAGGGVFSACLASQTYTLFQIRDITTDPVSGPAGDPLYGSEGGTGVCQWKRRITCGTYIIDITMDDHGQLTLHGSDTLTPFPGTICDVLFAVKTRNCLTGSSFYGTPELGSGAILMEQFVEGAACFPDTADCGGSLGAPCCVSPNFSSDITMAPSAGATWRKCGENSDGSPETGGGVAMAPMMGMMQSALGPSVKLSARPLPLVHPDRCEHFAGAGRSNSCGGWRCEGLCNLGLKAIPADTCQTCPKYEVDPDYAGQGPTGWLK